MVLVLRTEGPAWRSRPRKVLAWTTGGVAALALAAPYVGGPSRMFGFQPLEGGLVLLLAGLVVAYLAVNEAAKA